MGPTGTCGPPSPGPGAGGSDQGGGLDPRADALGAASMWLTLAVRR